MAKNYMSLEGGTQNSWGTDNVWFIAQVCNNNYKNKSSTHIALTVCQEQNYKTRIIILSYSRSGHCDTKWFLGFPVAPWY